MRPMLGRQVCSTIDWYICNGRSPDSILTKVLIFIFPNLEPGNLNEGFLELFLSLPKQAHSCKHSVTRLVQRPPLTQIIALRIFLKLNFVPMCYGVQICVIFSIRDFCCQWLYSACCRRSWFSYEERHAWHKKWFYFFCLVLFLDVWFFMALHGKRIKNCVEANEVGVQF